MKQPKSRKPEVRSESAEAQLSDFLAKYSPPIAALARKALTKMRKLVPGAIQLVYDNYNALVIGFCPSERASEGIFSIVLYPRYLSLVFLQAGARPIPDPKRLLQGSAKLVRHIRLESADDLDKPEVKALIRAALDRAVIRIADGARGKLIIRSISTKQRPRRPAPESAKPHSG